MIWESYGPPLKINALPSEDVRQKDGLYRVHAGPYPSQSDARKAADRIAQTLGFKPLLTSR